MGEKREVAIHWWDNVVPLFTSEDWLKNFRVSKSSFDVLCQKLSTAISIGRHGYAELYLSEK